MSDEEKKGDEPGQSGPSLDRETGDREPTKTSESYLDLVRAEISFARATGSGEEKGEMTVVVPLTELAIRQEGRLRQASRHTEPLSGAKLPPWEEDEAGRRTIPIGEVIDVLRAARTVEEVAGVLVEIIANLLPRVLLLWEHGGKLHGFACRGLDLPEVKLLTIEIPQDILTEMTGVPLELDSFRGPPHRTDLVDRFFELLGEEPPEVILVPVYVTPVDRWILYADSGSSHLPMVELRLIEVIVARAGARADLLLDRNESETVS